jgi:hypothetical protein
MVKQILLGWYQCTKVNISEDETLNLLCVYDYDGSEPRFFARCFSAI